jgi:hypothetical protein
MRRWQIATVFVFVCILVAGAADVFQTYNLDREGWAESFMNSVTGHSLYAPYVTPALKRVPVAQRAAVIASLGAAAKVYFASAGFTAKYKERYEQQLPAELKPPRTAEQISAEMRKDMEKGTADMEAGVKQMQGEARKQANAMLAMMKKQMQDQMKQIDQAAVQMAAEEKARHNEAVNRKPGPDDLSSDPKVSLEKTLKRFLETTGGVDFAAQTKLQHGLKRFVNDDYESKPDGWKRCYRAGREACDAARSFASAWLTELK